MKVYVKQLKEMKACSDGVKWLKKQKNKEAKYILRKLVKKDEFSWANWYVTRLFTKPQAVQYAIFAAKSSQSSLQKFASVFPNEDRPRKAIEAAQNWLNNPSKKLKGAAWSAAWSAAESATWSAAESAARSAAVDAAWSVVGSAESARSAAESAAWSAVGFAAGSACIEKAIEILGL